MNRLRHMLCLAGVLATISRGVFPQALATAPTVSSAATHSCDNLPHADHPNARIGSGGISAVIFLPDQQRGFYRGSRFDWAGVIGCLSYRGHTYFGEWFPRYDPLLSDSITGPVEEFRANDSELGYGDASAGGRFLKIGVGVLRKTDNSRYKFGAAYPIVDIGKRTTRISRRSVTFTQFMKTDLGYSYRYEKTVAFGKHGADLMLGHKLKNIGTKTIETDVYDHDFFMLDNKPTGPGMTVHLGFMPTPETPFPATAAIIGNEIAFLETATRGNGPQGYLTGFKGNRGEYNIVVEDRDTHVGVEQTSTSPLSKFYFWSTPTTICPEAYIHIKVLRGQTQTWEIRYHFKAG